MSRTVTALFDTRSEAEAARSRLSASSIDADRVRIIDQNEVGNGTRTGSEDRGLWASIKSAFMPEEDSHAYEEGMRRGGYLLCAEVDEDEADRAISLLDESGSVDFDRRQDEWRSQGWAGYQSEATRETGRTIEEERIPLVEEELRVGKREVARGGARVRSYVRETPVQEQVNLREEHVSVERRPVDQTLASGELDRDSDLLRDRTIEMTERAEEAVVDKEARVREEVVLRKTAEERTETIDDSVRRTEVDVDGADSRDRSAFGGFSNQSSELGSGRSLSEEERERERAGYGVDKDRL
jgi:uncharacterized protein (TIGR02271 family)